MQHNNSNSNQSAIDQHNATMANYFDLLNQHGGDADHSDGDEEGLLSDSPSEGVEDGIGEEDIDEEEGLLGDSVEDNMMADESISNSSEEDSQVGINSSSQEEHQNPEERSQANQSQLN